MRFPLRVVFFLSAIFTLAVAAPASAQYMFLDANANGIHDSGDQLNANATPTTVDVYLDTNHNRDGSTATCDTGSDPLSMISYCFNLKAVNGTVTYTGFTNQVPSFTIQLGTPLNPDGVQYKNALGSATPLAEGKYKLATITITGQTGSPRIDIIDINASSQDFTSFGSNCLGHDFNNTYALTGPGGGSDWTDVDGVTAAPGGGNVNPTLAVLATANGAENSLFSVTATATDPDAGNTLTISETSNATFLTFSHTPSVSPATATMSGTPSFTQSGSYVINWSVSDGAGGTDAATTNVNIAQTNRPPVLAAIGNRTVQVSTALTFTATATDPDGNALTWSLDPGFPAGATINGGTGVFSWTPGSAGTFPVTIRVTDSGSPQLDDFEGFTITVTAPANQAPVLGTIGNKTVAELSALTFTATATDPNAGDVLTFSLDAGAPAGATIGGSTGAFSWTPTEGQGPGSFPITVRVTDNGTPNLNDFEAITVTVTEVNVAPVVTNPGNKTVNELVALTFTATATDADLPANTITWTLDAGAPAGAAIVPGTGAFSWTPTEAQGPGTYPVTIRATDNGTPALAGTAAITITVNEVNLAPVLASIGNKSATVGAALTFTATATDADLPANALTFSLDAGAPAGATINSGTGAFSWTPATGQVGSNSITVRVTDNGTPALSAFETITVTVGAAPNQAPVLGAIGNKTVNELATLTFTATATDADGSQILTFSLDAGAPAGATIGGSTGAFSWTPTEAQGPGSFPVTVRVTDNGSPTMDDFEAITITVNEVNVAPVVTNPGNKTVNEQTPLNFTVTATDADVPANTLTFTLDAGAPALASIDPSTGAFNWTPSEIQGPGTYPVTIRATDNGTPSLSGTATLTITVNEVNQAPVLDPIGSKAGTVGVAVTFTATATDADIPANGLAFSLDAGAPAGAAINAGTGAFSWTPGANGTFPVTVRVTDNGTPSLSDFEVVSIVISAAPNQAPVLGAIGNKTVDELATLAFTATATDPNSSDVLTFSLDAGAPAGATIGGSTGAFSWTPTEAQGPGSFPITVRVTDDGTPNLSDNELITVTVNEVNVAPVLAPIGDKTVNELATLTFTATATDADVPANSLEWSLAFGAPSGATIGITTGVFSWTPTEAQGPGSYPVTILVVDNAIGNLSDTETINITVNEVNVAPVLAPIGNKAGTSGVPVTFTATATDPDVPANTLSFSLDAGAPSGATIDATTGAFSFTPGSSGAFQATVRVTDNGTPALSDFETVTIDVGGAPNQAPVLGAIGNKTVNEEANLAFTATATDPDAGQTLAFSLDAGSPAGAGIDGPSGAFSWTPTEAQGPGSYPITVRVTDDGAPNLDDSETITVTVNEVNVAPVLASIGNKSGTTGVAITFTATATDADIPANTLTFSLDAGAPAGATIGAASGAFSWTPGAAGSFPLTVRVTDNGTPALDAFEAITITVNEAAVNHPPVLAAIGDKTVDEQTLLAFTATATDPDAGDVLTFSLDSGSPAGATIDGTTGAFSWTPLEIQGPNSYSFNVRVTDNGIPSMTDFETISVTVNEVNQAPVLAPIGNKAGTVGVAVDFTATATDPDLPANTLAFSLDAGAPAGAAINGGTGAFSWTPSGAGVFHAIVRVTDNGVPAMDDFEDVTITVTEQVVNHAPVLDEIGNKTVDELTLLAFTATATDPDAGDVLTFTLDSGAPAGAAITTGGAFSWTPTEAQGPGSYPATVRVTDNGTPNLDDSETITIAVNEVNVAPVLAAIGNKSGVTGVAIAFTASATDADIPSNTLTFSLDAGAPSGATIDPSTGAFSWTPTAGGTYGATVRVTDNGVPGLDAFEAIVFTITEQVVNHAPVLDEIGNKTVDELTTLIFTATATDPDAGQTLTFSLDAGAPAGANINASSGVFGWTPTEAQGPGSFPITVRVTDNGTPVLNDFETITVTVNEVNVAPVLAAIANQTGTVGVAITFTATATDADIPANSLTFSLAPGAPSGATINAATGAFSWTPSASGTFPVTVQVTDNGTPALGDSKSLTINVTASQQIVAAHAFFFGLNLLTILESRDPFTCVQIEPVRHSFDIRQVDLHSIQMTYKGVSITASSQIDGDKNHNGDREIQACFSKPDLRRLFASLPRGLSKVTVDITGNLPNGVSFKDRVDHFVLVLGTNCLAIRVSPNPLNPETVLSFVTSKSGPASIQIFDVQGRLVKSLYNGTMEAGLNQVRWDGSSKNGNRVATGVYFIRTKTVDGEAVERATVLK